MTAPAPETAPAPGTGEPVAPAVDPAPVAPADSARPTRRKPKRGALVSYELIDPTTGARLVGQLGVAVDVPEDGGAVCVAPLQPNYLFVAPDTVAVVELDG